MRANKMRKEKQGNNSKKVVLWNIMMFVLMMAGAVLVPFLREGGQALTPVYLCLAGVLSLGAFVYACAFERKTAEGFLFWLIPLVYIISVAFLLLFDNPFTFPFWIFGGMLVLCAFRLRYGMLLNMFLLFVIGSLQTALVSEVLIIQIVCILLLGFVLPYARSLKDGVNVLVSVAAVLISVRLVCFFTMNKETLNETLTGDIFCVAVVYGIVICVVLLLAKPLQDSMLTQTQKESFDFLEELAAGTEEQDSGMSEYVAVTEENDMSGTSFPQDTEPVFEHQASDVVPDEALTAVLEELCGEQAPLLERFAERFPKAFLHVSRVALIAEEVAKQMDGVNVSLVKCGGYYHEIGRLQGAKSVEHTLAVAREEHFPEELQRVLREHTVDGDKPSSKEAALLLLTDNICSMCEHLKKTQAGKIMIVKVIEKAMNLRLSKGDFNDSGLSAGDLAVIRNIMAEVIKEEMF